MRPLIGFSERDNMKEVASKKRFMEFLFFYCMPLFIIILLIVYIFYNNAILYKISKEKDYGIIIDAGSNGTRLHLFTWKKREYESNNKINRLTKPYEIYNNSLKKSLSNIPINEIEDTLIKLVNIAMDYLKKINCSNKQKWKNYPFYFQATAGMRNLDSYERDLRMKIIRSVLSDSKINPFNFSNDYARVISGEEEGIYGWLSVNNALNTIFSKSYETFGAIDLGGASTQLTFFPVDTSILEDYNGIHLDNTLIRLYSHSFIGYGWNDSLFRINIILFLKKMLEYNNMNKISYSNPVFFFNNDYKNNGNPSFYELQNYLSKNSISNEEPYLYNSKNKNFLKDIKNKEKEKKKDYNNMGKYIENSKDNSNLYDINDHVNEINNFHLNENEYKNIYDFLYNEFIKYINEGVNYEILSHNDSYDYTYNIHNTEPYYVENFIKKIKNFKRNTENDTIVIIENPCLPYPFELKISLPTYNVATNEFVILKKKSKHNSNNDNIINDDVLNKDFESKIVLKSKVLQNNLSILENIYEDFKLTSNFEKIFKLININNADNIKDNFIKYIFQKNIIHKISELYINITVKFIGSNNFNECLINAQKLFYEESCFLSTCSFNGVYQPNLEKNKFVVYGQFKKVMKNLGFKKYINLVEMKNLVHKYCNLNVKELSNVFKDISNDQISKFCWKALWSYSLLHYGFKFNEKSKIIVLDDIIHVEDEEEDEDDDINERDNEDNNENKNENEKVKEIKDIINGNFIISKILKIFFPIKIHHLKKKKKINSEIYSDINDTNKDQSYKKYNNTNYLYNQINIDYYKKKKAYTNNDKSRNITDNVSWTQGCMIYQVNFFPKYINLRKYEIYKTLLISLSIIIFMIVIMLCGYVLKLKQKLKDYQSPIN
ncbi:apyrase, putative [Plasmodium gallinaceum]|uniref:Apyrase, putative n=1 Tax=Plasmodium gallinaceum TaxID=5849 RepID=A0A1J1GTG5_PLAGA|nr:apyrase, putative [Plasmodium gallinaceum]CRG95822.1 apyrase, putative [Plasmodium gallinaceum]